MPNVSEKEMRIYLLGGLSPERQTELAAEIHNDAELQEELLAIQEELFDQYLAGSLTADEQQYFETHFLSTDSGQQKLHFARLLHDYSDSHQPSFAVNSVPAPITPVAASSSWFANLHRKAIYAVSMVIVAGLMATLVFWVFVTKSRETQIGAQTLPTLTLTAGSTRSGGTIQQLRAPAKNDRVKLELEVAKSDFKKYKTQLFRENQALASQDELEIIPRNAHYVVPVTFTGNLLTPGDYQLKLSGVPASGEATYIDSYAFRVTGDSSSEAEQGRDRMAR
jgi:hypothetical protein